MGSLWEDIRDGIRDGIELVVDKTEEYSKIGKIKVDIIGIKRNIEKGFSELGGRTYEILKENKKKNVGSDADVKRLVDELMELEKSLDDKKNEIIKVREEKEKERREREESRKKTAEETEAGEDVPPADSPVEDAEVITEKKDKE
ncbi:MAG: hypothetical protein GWP06_06155 [Actinobacteria bacterium]|nr:hypothetical protein [Actinomycetota bacterium]